MDKINCILCKYRKSPIICKEIIMQSQRGMSSWHCPTLSNIYYGKLIYYFPFNLIFKIQVWVWGRRTDKEYNERSINQDV